MEEKERTMAGGERPSWTAFFLLFSRPSDFVTDSHNGLFFSFAFALSQKEEEAL